MLSFLVRRELIPTYSNKHTFRRLVNFSIAFKSLIKFVLGHNYISIVFTTTSLEFLKISFIFFLSLVLNHFLLLIVLINKSLLVYIIEFVNSFEFEGFESLVIVSLFHLFNRSLHRLHGFHINSSGHPRSCRPSCQ